MGVDRTFDYVPSLEAELAATKAKLAASDLEHIRLRAGLLEALAMLDSAGWQDEDKRTRLYALVAK